MYLIHNKKKYHCNCKPSKDMVYRGLPDDFPCPVSGEITLCADDGFVLRKDNTADYLRQIFENGTLVLTNEPEPDLNDDEAPNYPENSAPTLRQRVVMLEESMAALEDAMCEMDASNAESIAAIEDALCELDI